MPAFVKVAVALWAALVPLALKLTARGRCAGRRPGVGQAWSAPAGSVAETDRTVVVPVTGLGVAAAAVVIVGPESRADALPRSSTVIE